MTDEKENSGFKKSSWGFLDVITGRIGKIAALITAVVILLGAVEKFFNVWSNLFGIGSEEAPRVEVHPEPKTLMDCFKLEMSYPKTVPISKWDSMDLVLTGRNDCQQPLDVHVAFKTASNRIRIESAFSECLELSNPACWEEKILEPGDLRWKVTPPRLTPLKIPLGGPVKININWVIYNAVTKNRLGADTAQLQLVDDPAGR